MGCCGKKLIDALPAPKPAVQKKSNASKVKSIVKGNWNLVLSELKKVPDDKSDQYNTRLGICRSCDSHTWMTWAQFYRYINNNGGLIKFVKEIASLEDWPLLLKQRYASRRKLFCRVCKCFLLAKAASEDEVCPQKKWKDLNKKESS